MAVWTMGMARRLVKVCGGDPALVRAEDLQALDDDFPDLREALEALAAMGRRVWSAEDSEVIRCLYPDTDTLELAARLGASPCQVHRRARFLGVAKSDRFVAELKAQAARRVRRVGASTRFRPGHTPPNKGRKGWNAGGRSVETQFKPGRRPHTWKPIGTEKRDADGYLKRKVSEAGKQVERWRYVHVLVWEEAHGPVPKGHVVVFRDGNKTHIELENLELVSRAELMRRNTIHHLPEPIKRTLFAKARLMRVIGEMERSRDAEAQHDGPPP